MFELHKPEKTPVVLIRAASGFELSAADRRKLDSIEEGAQVNRIEVIKVGGVALDIEDKAVNISSISTDLLTQGT